MGADSLVAFTHGTNLAGPLVCALLYGWHGGQLIGLISYPSRGTSIMPSSRSSFSRFLFTRRAAALLPVAFLDDLAVGHPDAQPTKVAEDALVHLRGSGTPRA